MDEETGAHTEVLEWESLLQACSERIAAPAFI